MSDKTSIEWAESTWNPVSGCTKISDGCAHCYIDRTPPFRMAKPRRQFNGDHIGATTGVVLHPERLGVPQRWRKGRRIFVCSLADLFHDDVPASYIAEVWAVMSLAPQHTFQVLTKRSARMASLLNSDTFWLAVGDARMARGVAAMDFRWPMCLPNVWVGVTCESQQWADIRIPHLISTQAAVRWISAEPLIDSLDLTPWLPRPYEREQGGYWVGGDIHGDGKRFMAGPPVGWVVCGGESGPNARPMHPDWARSIRDQCQTAGVPYLLKQWGEWIDLGQALDLGVRPGGEIRAYPGALVKRVGKKAAGRTLDGRMHDEYPAAVPA